MRENAASSEPQPPLDIGHSKLNVWLVGRKLLPSDWHKRLNLVQKKVAQALLQEPEQASLLNEHSRDYWNVLALRDRLAETAAKTLLGGLTGPAATWDKLVKAYESRNIFLGETALLLVRNSDYEAPFLKGQVQKHQQMLSDLERRQVEYAKRSEAAAAAFQQECRQLGIAGLEISRELQKLPQQLPELMLAAIRDTVRVDPMQQAVQHYSAFSTEAHKPADSASGMQQQKQPVLPALAALLSLQGPDLHLKEPDDAAGLRSDTVSAEQQQSEVQHSQPAASVSQPSGLPASGEATAADAGGVSIDWDVDLSLDAEPPAPGESGDVPAEAAEIDWDIDMSAVEVQSEGMDTATAHHSSAAPDHDRAPGWLAKLLDSATARTALMDDLYELVAFLKQRQIESRAADTMAVVSPVSESLQQVTASTIDDMLSRAQAALASLSTASMKQLLLIRTSAPYLQRLVKSLEQSAEQELKLKRLGVEARRKHHEVQQTLVQDSAKLADLRKTTSVAKAALEERLAALLNGRAVNITGVSAVS